MSSLASHAVLISLICGAAAVLYGLALTRWVLAQSAGTDRMREIAAAIQEGAAAYLKRQYTTIAVVAVVVFLAIGVGYLVGQINLGGFSLGVGAVLFVGLAIGAFAPAEDQTRDGGHSGPRTI